MAFLLIFSLIKFNNLLVFIVRLFTKLCCTISVLLLLAYANTVVSSTLCANKVTPLTQTINKLRKALTTSKLHRSSVIAINQSANQKGFIIDWKLDENTLSNFSNLTTLDARQRLLQKSFAMILCYHNKPKKKFADFVKNDNFLFIKVKNLDVEDYAKVIFNKDFCANMELKDDISSKNDQQIAQGYYDEDYLRTYIAPELNQTLPKNLTNSLVLQKVKVGPGSKLTYTLNLYDKNILADDEDLAITKDVILNTFEKTLCQTKNFNSLLQMLLEVEIILVADKKLLASTTMTHTCN